MATNRIGFRQFRNKLEKGQQVNVVIDSNILIANYDETHASHELVREFLEEIDEKAEVTFFTTVTTKAEFLDYQRKRFLTEGLFDLVDEYNKEIPLSTESRAAISTAKGRRNKRQGDEEAKVAKDHDYEFDTRVTYLTDNEIKEIKKKFRARDIENETGWLKVCDTFLKWKLLEQEKLIDQFCEYLSPHKSDQVELFNETSVDWKKATTISGESGMGFSDSLILNMLLHTKIEFILTLDFDMIYAAAISAQNKSVVLPDKRISDFKNMLRGVQ